MKALRGKSAHGAFSELHLGAELDASGFYGKRRHARQERGAEGVVYGQ
jgi:hypothetical protein